MFWLGAVGIPYLALLALAAIGGGRARLENAAQIFIQLGIDACLLGIGVSGALFATHEVRVRIGENGAIMAVTAIFVDLIITGLCIRLADYNKWNETTRARLSIFLGLLVLSINTLIVMEFS